jgi:DNA-binding NtrC family response regulator
VDLGDPGAGRRRQIVAAARAGAYDAISLGRRGRRPRRRPRRQLAARPPSTGLRPGARPPTACSAIARAARTSIPVLLTSETGTSKDLAARMLRPLGAGSAASSPSTAPVPSELIESELFGHVRGAFSGAVTDYDGQLTAAMAALWLPRRDRRHPPTLQVKLLRVLGPGGQPPGRERVAQVISAWSPPPTRPGGPRHRGVFASDLYQRLAIVTCRRCAAPRTWCR